MKYLTPQNYSQKKRSLTKGFLSLVVTSAALCLASAQARADLIGQWNLNDGSTTTATDTSGNGNDGAIFGTADYVTGQNGAPALQFDGSSTYINFGNSSSGSTLSLDGTSFTVAFWMNDSASTGTYQRIINKDSGIDFNGGYSIYLTDTGVLGTSINTGSNNNGTFGSVVPLNTWTFVTVTYDLPSSTESVYENGTLLGTQAITGTLGDRGSDPLVFGQIPVYDQWYNGALDDVNFYNTALTQSQITSLMTETATPSVPEVSSSALVWIGAVALLAAVRFKRNSARI